jgi:hypothetical protein
LDKEEEPAPPPPPPCITTVVIPDTSYHDVDVDVNEQMRETDSIGEEGRRPCDGPSDQLSARVNMEMKETDGVGEEAYARVTWKHGGTAPRAAGGKYDSLADQVAQEEDQTDNVGDTYGEYPKGNTPGTPCNKPKPAPPPRSTTPVPEDWDGKSHDENIAGGEPHNKMLKRGGYDPDPKDERMTDE